MLAHVPPGTIQLGKKLRNTIDKGENGVELTFEDETVTEVDLVVGADGIRSVRTQFALLDRSIVDISKRLSETRPGPIMKSSSQELLFGELCFRGIMSSI